MGGGGRRLTLRDRRRSWKSASIRRVATQVKLNPDTP